MLVQLRNRRPDAEVEQLIGKRVDPASVRLLLEGDATVFKPNGQRLLTLRRGALSTESADRAYPFLHGLRQRVTYNRGAYAGIGAPTGFTTDAATGRRIKADGMLANTIERGKVPSVVVGSMDRYPRTPFCRECAANLERPEEWRECWSWIQEVGDVFASAAPDRYAAQLDIAKRTHPAYVIPGTPFTTLTVNNTFAGCCHRDAGDYEPGLGVMSVLRRGEYEGCWLVFPAYGVGVDLRDRDVILFDAHEVHGNTPFRSAREPAQSPDGHERISVVFYYRTKMLDCLAPDQERERAKVLRGSLVQSGGELNPGAVERLGDVARDLAANNPGFHTIKIDDTLDAQNDESEP